MRRPWSAGRDRLESRSKLVCVVALSVLAGLNQGTRSSDSGSESGFSRSSSSSFSSNDADGWSSMLLNAQGQLLLSAAEPYFRKKTVYAIGPQRWSFARIQSQFGTSASCKTFFRFTLHDMKRLLRALRFPKVMRTHSRRPHSASGEEVLCLLLRRLSYPTIGAVLCWECGRSASGISELVQAGVDHIYDEFEHLRDNRSLECWGPHFPRFARIIARGGGNSGPCPLTHCIGFVDGSNQRLSRPGRYQHILYNGHKRCHCVKWQGIMLPNGIMPMPFGPINGRNNDAFMLRKSGLIRIMRRICRRLGQAYCLYGDPAYPLSDWMSCPFKHARLNADEAHFNTQMSRTRIPNEWGFGKIKGNFAFLDFSKGMEPYKSDIQRLWPVAVILTNCHTCCYGSQTGAHFKVKPPDLFEYVQMGLDYEKREP